MTPKLPAAVMPKEVFHLLVYDWCMTRTNIDIDDEACAEVMRRYGLSTKREAVNFALRMLQANGITYAESRRRETADSVETPAAEHEPYEFGETIMLGDMPYRRLSIEEARKRRGESMALPVTQEEVKNLPYEAVNKPTLEDVLALQGIGWEGNLEEMRRNSPQLEAWLNRPVDEGLPALEKELLAPVEDDEVEGQQAT